MILAPAWDSLRRAVSWHRRGLAAVAAAIAVLALYSALNPSTDTAARVVAAAREVAPGALLSADDLELRAVPPSLLPERAVLSIDEAVGRAAAAGLTRGSLLTEVSVVAPRANSEPGTVIAPVKVRDPDVVALLRPGDRIDLLAADADGKAQTVASNAVIVALPQPPSSGGFADGGGTPNLVLVRVQESTATQLAELGSGSEILVVLR